MGKRGPAPTPTAELERRGSRRASTRNGEPTPPPEKPVCPRGLTDGAKKRWQKIVPSLHAMGVAFKIDSGLLVRYCELCDLHAELVKHCQEYGTTYESKGTDGRSAYRAYPEYGQMLKAGAELRMLERELGLTPSARSSLRVTLPAGPRSTKKTESQGKGRHFGGASG